MENPDIIFRNGHSNCGCQMAFSGGAGIYDDIVEIRLCNKHRKSKSKKTKDEVKKLKPYLIDPATAEEMFKVMGTTNKDIKKIKAMLSKLGLDKKLSDAGIKIK